MNTALSAETLKLLQESQKQGGYQSADELVQAALAALSRQNLVQMNTDILDILDLSDEQIDCGATHVWLDVREQVRNKFLGK